MFRFAHGGACAILRLCVAERVTGRRKRFAYGVEDRSLYSFLAALMFHFLHGSISLLSVDGRDAMTLERPLSMPIFQIEKGRLL